MRHILTLLIAVTILSGCSRNRNTTIIEGGIEGLKPDTTDIYLYGCDLNYEHIDTVTAINGEFRFKPKVDTLTLMTLRLSDRFSYPIFIDKGEKIEIEGSIKGENIEVSVKGNAINEELSAVLNTLNNADSIAKHPLKERVREYIANNSASLVSAYLLTHYLAYNDENANPDSIDAIVRKLAGSLHDNIMISALNEQIQVAKRATKDKYAPLFNLKNVKGETVNRNKNFKDKYLLMTFWASWDKASRSNNATLLKIYKQMKKQEKEFGMLGVALDMKKEEWEKAIKSDSLTWEQVLAPEMFNDDIVEQFGVTTLPLNILISPNGKIIGRGIPVDSIPSVVDKEIKLKKAREAETKKKNMDKNK